MSALLTALLPSITSILGKVLPDPKAASEAQLKLLELAQKGELANLEADVRLSLGQLEINKAEAQSGSILVGGWRPAVGWVCALGLAYQFLGFPILTWVGTNTVGWTSPPPLDMGTLLTLLFGLLGLGGYRTAEKLKGVAKP